MFTEIPTNENWFDHPIEVFPNNTDYGNFAWHGAYLIWMEEARVKCLSSIGINFADFVASGVDMPVVEIKSLKYLYPLRLGEKAIVKTRVSFQKPRIWWEYKIESKDLIVKTHVTCSLALATIDRDTGKILRRLPPPVQSALEKLSLRFS